MDVNIDETLICERVNWILQLFLIRYSVSLAQYSNLEPMD